MTSTTRLPGLLFMALLLGCFSTAQAQTAQAPLNDSEKALHVLNRLAYGPRPGDVDAVRHMGVKRYIDQQLRPDSLPLPEALSDKLAGLSTYQLSSTQLYQQDRKSVV